MKLQVAVGPIQLTDEFSGALPVGLLVSHGHNRPLQEHEGSDSLL